MDIVSESDDDLSRLLRNMKIPIKVHEQIEFKSLQWTVRMIFKTIEKFIEKFKDVVARYAIVEGYDLKRGVSDSRRKSISKTWKKSYK